MDLQNANPTKPMTRIVKDVLKVGRWVVGMDESNDPIFWNVTRADLHIIADTFKAHTDESIRHPLCWGHGRPFDGAVDERDCVADLDNVFVEGGTLWAASYVTPEEAMDLQRKPRRVSVRVVPSWMDGTGKTWTGPVLLHVAIVDHPVMHNQGNFVEMSMGSVDSMARFFNKERRDMAFTLNTWVDAINQFLPDGSDIPTEGDGAITEDNADETLALVLSLMPNVEDVTVDEPVDEPVEVAAAESAVIPDGGALDDMPVELSNNPLARFLNKRLGQLVDVVKSHDHQIRDMSTASANNRQDAFMSELTRLGRAGLPAKRIEHCKKIGQT